MDLITRLREIQLAHRWTDEAMGLRLKLSRPMWSAVRNGESKLGVKSLRAVVRAFPGELDQEVVAYLRDLPDEPAAIEPLALPHRARQHHCQHDERPGRHQWRERGGL